MTAKKTKSGKDDAALKLAVLDAALPHIAFDGFTPKLLESAAKEAGADKNDLKRLFPNGALDLIAAYSEHADREMETRLKKAKLSAMKVRERIKAAVKARLAVLKPHKEAARRTVAHLSLPANMAFATKLAWNTADAMWRAVGDTSTDFNYYTKRAILMGVHTSTVLRWLTDDSADESATDAFLSARIENVMQFEKLKAKAREQVKKMPSFSDVLAGFSAQK
jgi:ubiquinone biosynthesis protein COQ9